MRRRTVSDHAPGYRDAFPPVGKEKHWRSFPAADELALIRRYQKGDRAAGGELLRVHRRLIYSIARRYFHASLDNAELVQMSAIGFLKGAAHFEEKKARGGRLVPYARWWARAEVAIFAYSMRRFIRISRQMEQALTFLLAHGPDNPKSQELLRSSAFRDALLVEERVLSLEAPAVEGEEEDDGTVHPLETYLGSADDDPEARVMLAQATKKNAVAVHAALQALSETERVVIHLRLMTDPPSTLEEVGTVIGRSKERVRTVQEQALRKMAKQIGKAA